MIARAVAPKGVNVICRKIPDLNDGKRAEEHDRVKHDISVMEQI